MKPIPFIRPLPLLALCGVLSVAGCHNNDTTVAPSTSTVLKTTVFSAQGATVSDDPAQPTISLSIPAGALSADADLTVVRFSNPGAASDRYQVKFTPLAGGNIALSQAIKIALHSNASPTHPELAELVAKADSNAQRLPSFFRPSTQTVVASTTSTDDVYQVKFRTLQHTTGPAVERGRDVFMNDTFGNEAFFGGVLGLHTLLNNVDPVTAVSLGVQVDLTKVPQGIVDVMTGSDLAAKDAALTNPAVTKQLLQADAVIGVKANFDASGEMTSAGITCALCHVNAQKNDFELSSGTAALPIGAPQFNGVPNSAMNAGAIIAATPFVQGLGDGGATAGVLNGWGPGNFDIRALPDNVLDDGVDNPTNNPSLWNFKDLSAQGYNFGWDGLFKDNGTDNNALASQAEAVYDIVMHANGAFGTAAGTLPPELSITPPQALLDALAQAEDNQPGNDISNEKMLDVQAWMQSITSPAPEAFDEASAERGFDLFYGEAQCSTCHSSADLTGPGTFAAVTNPQGGLSGGIHVPGLRGVSHSAPYFSDGSAATLNDVVTTLMNKLDVVPQMDTAQQNDLVEYLKSL